MGADLFDDRRRRLLVVRRRVGSLAAAMLRVPRGALADPGFRAVAVLAQAEADFRFRIPDRLEQIDQVVLGRFLEARLHDEEAAFEVVDVSVVTALRMLRACSLSRDDSLVPWLTASLAAWLSGSACRRRLGGPCP